MCEEDALTAEWPRNMFDEGLPQPAPGPVGLAPSGARRTGATRSALRRRDLRLLLLSAATSKVGDFLYLVALTAYVFERTSSAAWVSVAVLSRFVPYCVLPALAGVVADRYERRLVMVAADLLQLVFMTALTVTAALSGPTLLVLAWAVLSASSATLYLASSSAMVAAVVPEDELAAANSMTSSIGELAFVLGPAAGGVLLLLTTPVVAFGVNAATFAVSSVLVCAIRTRSRPRPAGRAGGALDELVEGFRAFLAERTAVVLVGCLVAGTMVYGVDLVVLVLVSDQLLGTGTGGLGWLLAASGAGGVAGALLSARIAGLARARRALALLVLLTGVPLASLSVIRLPLLAYAVMAVEGVAIVALDVLVETALQRSLAPAVLGRVSGLSLSLTSVGSALGTLVAPPLVHGIGLPAALAVSGLVPVVLAVFGLLRLSSFDTMVGRGRHALAGRVLVLRRLRLLEGAGPVELERVAVACTEERVPAGAVVLRQGGPPDDLFILLDGVLGVDHEDGGCVRRINEMTGPDYLGEIGLVAGVPRTATVVAVTDATLWRVPGKIFIDVVSRPQRPSGVLAGGISTRLARSATAA
jgi:MFS family permease